VKVDGGVGFFRYRQIGTLDGRLFVSTGRFERYAPQLWRRPALGPQQYLASERIDIPGPAAINEMSATTLFFPGQTARIDPWGNLVVKVTS